VWSLRGFACHLAAARAEVQGGTARDILPAHQHGDGSEAAAAAAETAAAAAGQYASCHHPRIWQSVQPLLCSAARRAAGGQQLVPGARTWLAEKGCQLTAACLLVCEYKYSKGPGGVVASSPVSLLLLARTQKLMLKAPLLPYGTAGRVTVVLRAAGDGEPVVGAIWSAAVARLVHRFVKLATAGWSPISFQC
jgi:hypothetical protein